MKIRKSKNLKIDLCGTPFLMDKHLENVLDMDLESPMQIKAQWERPTKNDWNQSWAYPLTPFYTSYPATSLDRLDFAEINIYQMNE